MTAFHSIAIRSFSYTPVFCHARRMVFFPPLSPEISPEIVPSQNAADLYNSPNSKGHTRRLKNSRNFLKISSFSGTFCFANTPVTYQHPGGSNRRSDAGKKESGDCVTCVNTPPPSIHVPQPYPQIIPAGNYRQHRRDPQRHYPHQMRKIET